MTYKILISFILVLLFFSVVKEKTPAADTENISANTTAKKRLEAVRVNNYPDITNSSLFSSELLRFYQNRANQLAWLGKGRIDMNTRQLVEKLEVSHKEGLPGEYYNLSQIKSDIGDLKRLSPNEESWVSRVVQLDVLLSDAYLKYASDLSGGRVDPRNLDIVWEDYPGKAAPDITKYLEKSIENRDIAKSLDRLRPESAQYKLLTDAYNQLRNDKSEGGWPLPGNFSKMEENDTATAVVLLKKYLLATGDLNNENADYIHSAVFDKELTEAVTHFQHRHGLNPDGIVGKNTLKEMNRSIDYRLNQIKLNLDKLRWLPGDFGKQYIIINIPDFRLKYYENGKLVQEMNVVVGKTTHYTPALKDSVNYIVFNPVWNVPRSIATKEMLPKIKKDSSWLTKNNYMLLKGSYASNDTIDAAKVKWSEITEDNFPFFVVQKPGGSNALGRVKFVMPNNQSIYLHDTPANYLFNRAQRNFSHGCIRLQKPVKLAQLLLENQLPLDSIQNYLAKKETKPVKLDNRIPVNIVYQTTWVDPSGQIEFRDDIYGFDKISLAAFEDNNPTARTIR